MNVNVGENRLEHENVWNTEHWRKKIVNNAYEVDSFRLSERCLVFSNVERER